MRGRVVGVSAQKVDKRSRPYFTVEAVVRIPCYSKEVASLLQAGRWYDLVLLSKHEFVELTGARVAAWQEHQAPRSTVVDVPRVE